MTTGRRPRFPIDDLADTLDEAEAARHRSGPIALTPAGEVADTDTEVDGWEQIRRFRAEVAEVRTEAAKAVAVATNALAWNRRIVYALSGLAGVAGTALTFAFAVTRASGDAAGEKFATAANNGFYRIETIAAKSIVFDRSPNSPVTDTGTGKTIRVFFGHVIKNEQAADIVARTYQLERKLTSANYEYLLGAMPNVLALDIKTADKITIDLSFVAMDGDTETAAKSGGRPDLPSGNFAFNSSSDFTRLRLLDDTAGGSLATYLQDLKLTIDNGVTPAKAIGTIGSIDLTPGDFMVNGTVEAYFSTLTAVDAVRANDDVSLDFALVAKNLGWLFDVPLITLGDARLKVEKDKPIILPLSLDAAAHETLDHTLLVVYYTYLPSAAQ